MPKKVTAELTYRRNDGTDVQEDISPPQNDFARLNDHYRKFLHLCLEEWLNNSDGTGGFHITGDQK